MWCDAMWFGAARHGACRTASDAPCRMTPHCTALYCVFRWLQNKVSESAGSRSDGGKEFHSLGAQAANLCGRMYVKLLMWFVRDIREWSVWARRWRCDGRTSDWRSSVDWPIEPSELRHQHVPRSPTPGHQHSSPDHPQPYQSKPPQRWQLT